ncbi:GyrI-like domain-containing protein [Bacillus salacetis]|nr:effector binding domain-containing protein [Bacillus salacetis]
MACDLIEKEFLVIGNSTTANFPDSFPEAAIRVQQDFEEKREQVTNAVDKNVLISPYMSNEIMTTYFACLEVTSLDTIPAGMCGFKIPVTKYARVTCTNRTINNAYTVVFDWIKEKGFNQKRFSSSFPIEIYYLTEKEEEEVVEILIPLEG